MVAQIGLTNKHSDISHWTQSCHSYTLLFHEFFQFLLKQELLKKQLLKATEARILRGIQKLVFCEQEAERNPILSTHVQQLSLAICYLCNGVFVMYGSVVGLILDRIMYDCLNID